MQIERHHIGEAEILAARDDFANRIGRQVHSMSKAGPVTGSDWELIAEEFLNYLGALSVDTPDLHTSEAKAVLRDATEAAVGMVAYAAYYPVASFGVFLDYVNWGMTYDGGERGEGESISAYDWITAFCLSVLDNKTDHHGEAFHFARQDIQKDAVAGRPASELIHGFMAYVSGDLGDDDANHPPSKAETLAALDAALARVQALEAASGGGLAQKQESMALRGLRALAAGNKEDFAVELAALLTHHHHVVSSSRRPDTLLPPLPLALAALAYRREGWPVPVESGYLPHALVTGFETQGPRVAAYGRDRRVDAVAQLAAGTVEVDRPKLPSERSLTDEHSARLEADIAALLDPSRRQPPTVAEWSSATHYQHLEFRFCSLVVPEATEALLRHLNLASRLGAETFRALAGAEPGESNPSASRWCSAVNFALITGIREHLAPLVLANPTFVADGSAYSSYYQALHDYLRGVDPKPATDLALQGRDNCIRWGILPHPAILLSQLVDGDEVSFNLALLDALEEHRDHFQVADRADDPDAALNLSILALACHARRRGWNIRVSSPYLPARLLAAAEPFVAES